MTEETGVADAVPMPRYPHLAMGEDFGDLLGFAGPFRATAGFLEVSLYYWVHEHGVLLMATIVPPSSPATIWRRFWTSSLEALRVADNLACEAEAYLRDMTKGAYTRTVEDLDYDDFVDHLRARIYKEFH